MLVKDRQRFIFFCTEEPFHPDDDKRLGERNHPQFQDRFDKDRKAFFPRNDVTSASSRDIPEA